MTDTKLLQETIKAAGVTIVALAKACDLSREAFYNKLTGESEFKASEIHAVTRALRLTKEERDRIFFYTGA